MKPLSLHAASLLLALASGCGRGVATPDVPGGSFDAGAVFYDTTPKVVHTFQVRNPTDRVVRVKEIRKSCTCTEAKVDKMELAPGEVVDLTMTVNARPSYNEFMVDCSLETDHPDLAMWTYRLTFRSYPRARFEVATVDLGDISRARGADIAKVAWLELYEPANGSKSSPSIRLESRAPITASLGPEPVVESIEGGVVRRTRQPVRVDLDRQSGLDGPSGTLTETVTAKVDGGAISSAVVMWSRSAPMSASPANLSFGILKQPGERSSKQVVLRARDDRPFRILSVAGGSADVAPGADPAARKQDEPSATHVVGLTYTRGPEARSFASGQALVQTDHPEMPLLRVSWSAITP